MGERDISDCVEDDGLSGCDCADRVPANLPPEGWTCPKCDAEWFLPDDEDDQ